MADLAEFEASILSLLGAKSAGDTYLENVVLVTGFPKYTTTSSDIEKIVSGYSSSDVKVYCNTSLTKAVAVYSSKKEAQNIQSLKMTMPNSSGRLFVEPCSAQIFSKLFASVHEWLEADYHRVSLLARDHGVKTHLQYSDAKMQFVGDFAGLRKLQKAIREKYIIDVERPSSSSAKASSGHSDKIHTNRQIQMVGATGPFASLDRMTHDLKQLEDRFSKTIAESELHASETANSLKRNDTRAGISSSMSMQSKEEDASQESLNNFDRYLSETNSSSRRSQRKYSSEDTEKCGKEEISMDEDILSFMFKVKKKDIGVIESSNAVKISRTLNTCVVEKRNPSSKHGEVKQASEKMAEMYTDVSHRLGQDNVIDMKDSKITVAALRDILERADKELKHVFIKNNLNNFEIILYGEKKHRDSAMEKLKNDIRDCEDRYSGSSSETTDRNAATTKIQSSTMVTLKSVKPSARMSQAGASDEYLRLTNSIGGRLNDVSNLRFSSHSGKDHLRRSRSVDDELLSILKKGNYNFMTNEGLQVEIKLGDITKETVDVIVNAANEALQHAGGVSKAIVKAGGQAIQHESDKWVFDHGYLNVSSVAWTGAGRLKAGCILHACGPILKYHGDNSERLLFETVLNVLNVSDSAKMQSIAIPAISSGVNGMPKEKCAMAMFEALYKFSSNLSQRRHSYLRNINFIDNEDDTVRAFIKLFYTENVARASGDRSKHGQGYSHNPSPNIFHSWHSGMIPIAPTPVTNDRQGSYQRAKSSTDDSARNVLYGSMKESTNTALVHISSGTTSQSLNNPVYSSVTSFNSTGTTTYTNASSYRAHSPYNHTGATSMNYTSPSSTSQPSGTKALQPLTGIMPVINSVSQDGGNGDCSICADDNVPLRKLLCCGFPICSTCAGRHFASNSKCPSCQKVIILVDGNQPRSGDMKFHRESSSLPGYDGCGTLVIQYYFPDDVQEASHPNPGKRYAGTYREAYLPDNTEGRAVLALLEKAFKKRLLFTIGTSHTTGQTDCVVWNDVHHKTSRTGGPTKYGYPDQDYLRRVQDELAAKGIK